MRRSRLGRAVFTCVLLAMTAASARAHDLGRGQVVAVLSPRDGGIHYTIDVAIDPAALLMRLGLNGMIDACAPFVGHVSIVFDGRRATPACEFVAAARGSVSAMRLTGVTPPGARTFTWSDDLMYGSYPLAVQAGADRAETEWLQGPQTSTPIDLAAHQTSLAAIALQYLRLGFTHILPGGFDHVLFVVGLFLLTTRVRPVLMQITTFTIAHSITLGLTIYGIVSVDTRIVEPLIAVSIVYVAVENVVTTDLKWSRLALVFAFGLLHGMGFAGVLRELGIPRQAFAVALVAFNAGVEAGQLAVIATVFFTLALWFRHRDWYRRLVVVPASVAMAIVAAYWTVARLV